MVQFKVLSNHFDEESKIKPVKVSDQTLKKKYATQLKKLDKMGVDMTKTELSDLEL